MANRSDRNSKFPRQIKRLLALSSRGNAQYDGEVRKLFIEAHTYSLETHKRMLTQQDNTDRSTQPEVAATPRGV